MIDSVNFFCAASFCFFAHFYGGDIFMPWLSAEYDCGNCVIVKKYFSTRYGSKGKITYDTTKDGKTTRQQKACNDRKAEMLYDILANANFKKGDYFITYTFARGKLPKLENGKPDIKRCKRIWKTYRDKLRAYYRKCGKEIKYLYSFQYEDCRPHFHLLFNNDGINPADLPEWQYGTPKLEWLDGRQYHSIGEYFARGTPVETVDDDTGEVKTTHKRGKLGSSRNLIRPTPKIKRLKKPNWNIYPKAKQGYNIDEASVENGYIENPYNQGTYRYQFYRMVRRI